MPVIKATIDVDSYFRQRRQDWADLWDLGDHVSASTELQAYFLLNNPSQGRSQSKSAGLSVEVMRASYMTA